MLANSWPRYTLVEYGHCLGVMVDSLVVAFWYIAKVPGLSVCKCLS